MISRDVEFNEKEVWDREVDDSEKYDFLLIFNENEERYKYHQEPIVTPSQTLMSLTSPSFSFFSFSSGNLSSGTSSSPLRKMRSCNDLYEVTNPIDDVILYDHFATCDPIVFEETIKDEK